MYSEKPQLHRRQKSHRPGSLRTIALDVTPACNMFCGHCYAETFRQIKPISLDVLLRVLDEFYELGVFHYVLQGGEPITNPERLKAILRGCHPDETYINVVSNGWAMTRKRIHWLKLLKVDKITFSLDSGIPSEHDANRLVGSFSRVLRSIDDVLDEGLLTSISTVVTHASLHSEGFQKAFDLALRKRIRIDVQIAEPVGKWDGKKDNLITKQDHEHIARLREDAGRLENGQMLVNRDIYSGNEPHCPAGTEFMAVSPDGHFLPCNFLQYTLGRIGERPIKDMREDLLTCSWYNGQHPVCICGEDDVFIDTFITPHQCNSKPLDAYAVFDLPMLSSFRAHSQAISGNPTPCESDHIDRPK